MTALYSGFLLIRSAANLVILGKLIPYYLINLIQFVLMLIVGIYIMPLFIKFPFSLGAHPWHLMPVTLVVAAASTGFGVLIAALARAPEQSSALGGHRRGFDGCIRRHYGAARGYAACDEKTGDDFADVLGASGLSGCFFARSGI